MFFVKCLINIKINQFKFAYYPIIRKFMLTTYIPIQLEDAGGFVA